MSWSGWPFERVALLFTGVAFWALWLQVALLHWGGAYHKWQMWVPVGFGPILGVTGIAATLYLSSTAGMVIFGIGLLIGLVGFFYHIRAIGHYIMGYNLRNFIAGPPPLLPLMYAALSGLGILAIYWRMV